jgi:cysteine desulfurase
MLPFLGEIWGNPSSVHSVGRTARAALDDARYRLAGSWRSKPSEVVFTSGGTEANNLAVFGTARLLKSQGRHLVASPIEHHAVLHAFQHLAQHEGFEVTWLPVDELGRVRMDDVAAALRPDTTLVSVMAANNEVGTLQPVAEIGALCRARGVKFHTDAVQAFGKLPFADIHQFNADLVSVCAHKFHGPKGAGALFIRSPLWPDPTQFGGGHENERRAGTENLAGIIGFTEALERFVPVAVFARAHLEPLTSALLAAIAAGPGVRFVGARQGRLANTVAVVVEHADSIALLAGLDMEGICASSGSACSAGSLEPSHVVSALGLDGRLANALVRFSLGRASTEAEVARVTEIWPEVVRRAQRCR